VFTSGALGFDPKTMEFVEGGVEGQARQALINMQSVLQAAGSDLSHVVKTTVFLKSMDDFAKVNAVYSKFFSPFGVYPARSAVEVSRLPKDAQVEIECIAKLK